MFKIRKEDVSFDNTYGQIIKNIENNLYELIDFAYNKDDFVFKEILKSKDIKHIGKYKIFTKCDITFPIKVNNQDKTVDIGLTSFGSEITLIYDSKMDTENSLFYNVCLKEAYFQKIAIFTDLGHNGVQLFNKEIDILDYDDFNCCDNILKESINKKNEIFKNIPPKKVSIYNLKFMLWASVVIACASEVLIVWYTG